MSFGLQLYTLFILKSASSSMLSLVKSIFSIALFWHSNLYVESYKQINCPVGYFLIQSSNMYYTFSVIMVLSTMILHDMLAIILDDFITLPLCTSKFQQLIQWVCLSGTYNLHICRYLIMISCLQILRVSV